jgi:hypothetical protein
MSTLLVKALEVVGSLVRVERFRNKAILRLDRLQLKTYVHHANLNDIPFLSPCK